LSSTLSITSGAVFNKVLLFMLKEADGIFRRMLGLTQDSTTAAAGAEGSGKPSVLLAEQVTKAQRWHKVGLCVKERGPLVRTPGRVQRHNSIQFE
jgi:nucleolar complex protein 2